MIFVQKGEAPLTEAQLERRAQKYIARDWPAPERERSLRTGDGAFNTFMEGFSQDHAVNVENNLFNAQLDAYQKAQARLAQYELSKGRPEVYEDQRTGEFDEEGNEITEPVLVQPAIEPLEPTVEQTVYDEDGNASTETVPNPLIVKDEEERAAAQAVIDKTLEEVKTFAGA